jgi:hypothetical protein
VPGYRLGQQQYRRISAMAVNSSGYPATLTIDYPDRPLDRLTTFFRLITIIPIAIVLDMVSGSVYQWTVDNVVYQSGGAGGILIMAVLVMILFRQKYPRWWFDWNLALARFGYRVSAYMSLLRDEYPSTDEEQAVHLNLEYPDAEKDIDRGMPLVKWFLAIPHYIVLAFLSVAAVVSVIIAWFAIIFTGRYPVGLFNFVTGVLRWSLRVSAYAALLITDRYPPFSLEE